MKNTPPTPLKRGARNVNEERFLIDKTVEKLIAVVAIVEFSY